MSATMGAMEALLADAKRAPFHSTHELAGSLEHKQVTAHSVLATLLSSRLEVLIRGAFCSWRIGMTCEVLGVEEVATLRTAKEELGAHRNGCSAIALGASPTETAAALARLEAELTKSRSHPDDVVETSENSGMAVSAEFPDMKKMVDSMMVSTKLLQHREEAAHRGFRALSEWNQDLVLRASFFAWRKAKESRRSTPRKPGRLTVLESDQHELKQRLATLGESGPSPDSPAGSSFSTSGLSPSASATPTVPSAPAALALEQKLSKASSEEGDAWQDRRPADSDSEPEF